MRRFFGLFIGFFFGILILPGGVSADPLLFQKIVETPTQFSGLIIGWEVSYDDPSSFQIRIWEKNEWGLWYDIEDDPDRDEHGTVNTIDRAETFFLTNESQKYEYRTNVTDFTITPINYGKKMDVPRNRFAGLDIPNTVRIIKRDEWGANEEFLYETGTNNISGNGENFEKGEASITLDETDPEIERIIKTNEFGRPYRWPIQYARDIKFVVVHHTASVRNLDNPIQALQNLYYYHSVKEGWGDVGYHYVIDPRGNIYEGRQGGSKVIGGHARNLNKVSVGIAVIGNYEGDEIPTDVLRSLLNLVNFISRKYDIDPDGITEYKGKNYKNINGHRDINATICPGRYLYQKLYGLREFVAYDQRSVNATNFSEETERDMLVIPPEQKRTFAIHLKNTSSETWPIGTHLQATPEIVGFEDLSFSSSPENILAITTLKNSPVPPNQTGIFEGKVRSTLVSSFSIIELRLAIPEKPLATRSILLPIFVEGLNGSYEIAEEQNLIFKLRNRGNFTWKKSGRGMVALITTDNALKANLQEEQVVPGKIGTFLFQGKIPTETGVHKKSFRLTADNIPYAKNQNDFLEFNIQMPTDLPKALGPIRIKLGFTKAPLIRTYTATDVYGGTKFIKQFPKNTIFRIQPLEDNQFRVITEERVMTITAPLRIQPKFNNRFTIINWKRTPFWNPKINDNQFRGFLEIRKEDDQLVLINELSLENYLKGVAEVTNDTPYEKIKTMTILARTYALFYMTKAQKFPGKSYHLDDDPQNTQKYLGYGFEKRAPNVAKAVKETSKEVVIFQGKLVKTPYFSQSDGRTRSAQEVWGWTDTPYLQSVSDSDCQGPLRGHGVGLSGCGADAMARRGKTVDEIIKYYYQDVDIIRGNW